MNNIRLHTSIYFEDGPANSSTDRIFRRPGVWEPVLVRTQEEKDYLAGLSLIYGKDLEVHVRGVTVSTKDTPWSCLSIVDLSLP